MSSTYELLQLSQAPFYLTMSYSDKRILLLSTFLWWMPRCNQACIRNSQNSLRLFIVDHSSLALSCKIRRYFVTTLPSYITIHLLLQMLWYKYHHYIYFFIFLLTRWKNSINSFQRFTWINSSLKSRCIKKEAWVLNDTLR